MELLKKILILLVATVFYGSLQLQAQKFKSVTHPDTKETMLVGMVNLKDIEEMDGFENLMTDDNFKGDAKSLERIAAKLQGVSVLAYIGTWCSDSQYQFPEFVNLMKHAGYDVSQIKIIALDHEKKTLKGEAPDNKVEFVPTLIFFKEEKELGRIVEQPSKSFLKDIETILNK